MKTKPYKIGQKVLCVGIGGTKLKFGIYKCRITSKSESINNLMGSMIEYVVSPPSWYWSPEDVFPDTKTGMKAAEKRLKEKAKYNIERHERELRFLKKLLRD